jgi:hypothetical protein
MGDEKQAVVGPLTEETRDDLKELKQERAFQNYNETLDWLLSQEGC